MRRTGWKGKLAADKSQVWKQGDQTDGHHLLAHPPLMHNHLTNVFTVIAEVRSVSKVCQHREEEVRTGRGWEETETLGRKQDTGCRAERRAGVSSREWRESVPMALVKEQNNTCQSQGHLSTKGVRNGRKNFLPPEQSHPSLQGNTSWALLLLKAGSGTELPTLFLLSNWWERGHHTPATGWEVWVSSRIGAMSYPLILRSPSQVNVRLSAIPVHGKGTLGYQLRSLQREHGPCSLPTLCTRTPSDRVLQWTNSQNSCTYFPLFYPVNHHFTLHADILQTIGTAGVTAHLQHSLAFCGIDPSLPTE